MREQTRRELTLIQRQLGTTSIYVTHDQQEALALSDRIAVMNAGRLIQVGSPESLYRFPETAFVARFLGGSNIITNLKLAELLAGEPPPAEGKVLAVRPEHLAFSSDAGVSVRVKSRQFLGAITEWWMESEGQSLRAWVDPDVDYGEDMKLQAKQFRWVLAEED